MTSNYRPVSLFALFALAFGLLLAAGCGDNGHVPVSTEITRLQFADPVLRACVLRETKLHHWQTAGEVAELHCPNPEGAKIKDISRIENLVNLRNLDLAHNAISDITLLDRLPRLDTLDLGYNRIKLLPIGDHRVTLQRLNLHHNEIEDI
ncbi:MAG TPA: leucine-rich repeat domain-containing protein, partial [Gammaproteobacteria bacterium]|nr:leucine-rich repeat domain-containing protein [Gammaproteobacteria bacterium]